MVQLVRRAASAALVTAAFCAGAIAQQETPEAAEPRLDPKAEAIIKKLAEHYSTLDAVSCTIDLDMNMSMGQGTQKMATLTEFAAERPNRFASRLKEGDVGVTIVSDGETLYTYVKMPMAERYMKEEAPPDFAELAEKTAMASGMSGAGEGQLLLGLMAENGYENIMEGVSEATFIGAETIDEKELNHIKLVREEVDLDVWIAANEEPWLVRIVPDVEKAMAKMAAESGESPFADMKVEINVDFDKWSTDKAEAGVFTFEAPKSAELVESLFEPMEQPELAGETELLDKPAPDFTLKKFGSEEEVTLSDHKGKDIVVLDFWATWCGPCKQGLPVIDEVTQKYKDKGVVFYSVDLVESERSQDHLPKLMSEKGWTFNVLLDSDSKTAEAYRVGPIPHTVIISKNGVVEAVHIGLLPNLREQLAKELDELIATGKLENESH